MHQRPDLHISYHFSLFLSTESSREPPLLSSSINQIEDTATNALHKPPQFSALPHRPSSTYRVAETPHEKREVPVPARLPDLSE